MYDELAHLGDVHHIQPLNTFNEEGEMGEWSEACSEEDRIRQEVIDEMEALVARDDREDGDLRQERVSGCLPR